MNLNTFLFALVVAVGTSWASSPYEDIVLRSLYDKLADLDSSYSLGGPPSDADLGNLYDSGLNYDYGGSEEEEGDVQEAADKESGPASIRDQEHVMKNPNIWGFQHMSGGAGEGKQHLKPEGDQDNKQEVKTDEALPFYCHPPNPCPKGFSPEKHNCRSDIQDTADFQRNWILSQEQSGACACDSEHMYHCPKDGKTVNSEKEQTKHSIDDVLDSLLGNDPSYEANKRLAVVAKKSPRIAKRMAEVVPSFDGWDREDPLPVVAKKGKAPEPVM